MAPVKLGSNRAAQVHADGLLANCHGGHWSTDGLKPYMRYTLAGGYQVNAENVSGSSYCFDEEGLQLLDTALTVAMDGLMKSKGHRKNILNPTHRAVSLGISCDDDFRCAVVQIFEGEYIEYHSLPLIRDGILSLSATAVGGAGFSSDDDLIVVLQWDPPPRALTRGQLARTSSYGGGVPIVGIVRSREGGNIPPRPLKYRPPYDPHSVPADMAPPQSWRKRKSFTWKPNRQVQRRTRPSNCCQCWELWNGTGLQTTSRSLPM